MQRRARVGGRRSIRGTIMAAMVRHDAHDVRGQRHAVEHALRGHLRRLVLDLYLQMLAELRLGSDLWQHGPALT